MGLFGSIGGGLRKLGHGIGKIADNKYVKGGTALGLQFIPGIGTAASMGIMAGMGAAGGALKPGGNLGSALGGGLGGAASGYGASRLRSLGGSSGGLPGPIVGGEYGLKEDGFVDKAGNFIKGAAGMLGGGKDGGGFMDTALTAGMIGLGYDQMKRAGEASKRSGEMSDKALEFATNRWNNGAELRSLGKAGLVMPRARPNFDAIYADPTNKFARRPLGSSLG